MENSRERIMASAIRCVGEHGLEGTRTLTIARGAGVSEALLFKLFGSKDALLRACFEAVDQRIAGLFDGLEFTPRQIREEPEDAVFLLWSRYFQWLVTHRDETLFYFAFRTAPWFPDYEKQREAPWFRSFVSIFWAFDQEYRLYCRFPPAVLWTQVLTGTQLYAKLVLEGRLPKDDATIRAIFDLQMGGLCAFIKTGGTPPP